MAQPGTRLVTQNLLASASACLYAPEVTWNGLQDLCILIDLFCLYDELRILGRLAYDILGRSHSDFGSALRTALFVDEFTNDTRTMQAACGHLGAFLGADEDAMRFQPLFTAILTPDSVSKAFSRDPDTESDVDAGRLWLQTLPPGADIIAELTREKDYHRAITFLTRSFLYLAYADANSIPLTPDRTRVPVLKEATRNERNLRQRLLAKLNEQPPDNILTDGPVGGELTRQITPLASIVFDRAYPDRENIVKYLLQLREELAPMRARIAQAEDSALWGSKRQEITAANDWQKAFDEIERSFGKGESLVNLSSLLGFAEGSAGAYLKPEDAKGWFKILDLPIEIIRRLLARRSVVELYELRNEIPASGRLNQTVNRLFGEHLRQAPGQQRT